MTHCHPALETKLLDVTVADKTGTFEGYASVFDITDSTNDRIERGAFEKSLQKFRAEKRLPPLLWQHDMKQPIGAWREIFEDARGLFVSGTLFIDDIAQAREAYKLLREDVVTGLSIGYRVIKSHRDTQTGVRVLTDVELLEISMVTLPANQAARVTHVKSLFGDGALPSERAFESFLRDAGMSRKQAKGFIAHGYKSLITARDAPDTQRPTVTDHADIAALRALTRTIRNLV